VTIAASPLSTATKSRADAGDDSAADRLVDLLLKRGDF